ncbi:hypothetical protein DFQ27_005073 [Actinomortierella ambigua]|uniref:Calpain catalytic domain-containing protein n=1 Tax=Actinomortierella ambigua TaxID=1343610 RepID=A0A9P6PZZ0_9FUNG|nr:hypothetical protein DFQ27_005073 [Actinomortierella ambigua]
MPRLFKKKNNTPSAETKQTKGHGGKRSTHKKPVKHSVTLAATASKQAAIEACIAKVDTIVRECRASNTKFRDATFDLRNDRQFCLYSSLIVGDGFDMSKVKGVRRITELYPNAKFFVDGVSPDDVQQGSAGDCWILSSLANIANIPGLLEQLCVKRDEEIGVYGFIFFRDGDWISTVVDDQFLYCVDEETGKAQLFFAKCENENETWLPLIEKAFAKIHGDYEAIVGGFFALGVEDLTGGVSTLMYTSDILDTDQFWEEEMLQVNKSILMGCSISYTDMYNADCGLINGHAYSVLEAVEYEGERLVHIRNPWGAVEWKGDWSDDSDKWTPEAIEELNAHNKDDGKFWMSYKDFLRIWTTLGRCRVFDARWSVANSWIPYNVEPKSSGRFHIELNRDSKCVIVLSQPDDRYYGAFLQDYTYELAFHLRDEDHNMIKRAKVTVPFSYRSVSCELDLPAGNYVLHPQVVRKPTGLKEEGEGEDDAAENAATPSTQLPTGVVVEEEAKQVTKPAIMFAQRKAKQVREMALVRTMGKKLVIGTEAIDEEDNSEDEGDEEEGEIGFEDWQIMLGLRIYSHDPSLSLEGIAGPHPWEEGAEDDEYWEDEEGEDDPERVTAALNGNYYDDDEEEYEDEDEREE